MSRTDPSSGISVTALLLALALLVGYPVASAQAQDRPPERQIRTYIPPDQLVSFQPSTPFNQFIEFVNPIFERVTGRRVVDPEDRTDPIGVSIAGAYFFDALESVLQYHELTYRETDRFYVIEPAPTGGQGPGVQTTASAEEGQPQELPASVGTREIRIDAVLFDMNLTKARQLGIDWNVLFGDGGGGSRQGGGTGGGGTGGGQGGRGDQPQFFLKTDRLFSGMEDIVSAPERIDIGTLTRLFRLLENEGAGETVANPTVTVQSGEQGRIQVGADVPIQTRDFSGNTITEFISTGIIVDVTPTLIEQPIADTLGAPLLDFVHLNVQVENSNSSPSQSGPVISRNTANTQVLLLNGEQTIIGGLYSTDESVSRRGIPLLKDLPPWFFGLRYVFGYEQKSVTQRELLIVLQARIVDPLEMRAQRPFDTDLIEQRRQDVRDNLQRVGDQLRQNIRLPEPPQNQDQ